MADIETIMSWLDGLTEPDWRMFHSDSEVQTIAKETLDLLKKQEPKQVICIADSIEGMEVGYCPSCNRGIVNKKIDETKFCKFCGQAVKWE